LEKRIDGRFDTQKSVRGRDEIDRRVERRASEKSKPRKV
jgi:hypothetical protein